MTITVNLIGDGFPVLVDDLTAQLGGSFYYEPLRPYSPLPLKWCYDQLIKYSKATLIDVGASTGCFTLLAAHHPDLRVHAFEPVPLTCEVLRKNVDLNGLYPKVDVHQAGVSNYDGMATLHSIRSIGGSGVSMVNGTPAWHKAVDDSEITVVTLDQYCQTFNIAPRFIKIDTEGGEKFVLEGARQTIAEYHPFLLLEYSQENADQYGYAVNDLVKFVEEAGYTWVNPEGMDLWCVHREWEKLT